MVADPLGGRVGLVHCSLLCLDHREIQESLCKKYGDYGHALVALTYNGGGQHGLGYGCSLEVSHCRLLPEQLPALHELLSLFKPPFEYSEPYSCFLSWPQVVRRFVRGASNVPDTDAQEKAVASNVNMVYVDSDQRKVSMPTIVDLLVESNVWLCTGLFPQATSNFGDLRHGEL